MTSRRPANIWARRAHRLAYGVLGCSTLGSLILGGWLWAQNPLARPLVARSAESAQAALTRAMAWRVDAAWLVPQLEQALAAGDYDDQLLLVQIANAHDIALPPDLLHRMAAFAEDADSLTSRTADCAACAYDIARCERIAQIAACAIPIELSPLGDVNALRRAGVDYMTGHAVDQLDVALALTGLGATALVVYSGGTSLTVKAGASLIRVGRGMGAVGAGLLAQLNRAADVPVQWARLPDFVLGRAGLETVTDTRKLAELGALAADLGDVRAATSTAQALALMRYVDSADDAADLARVARLRGAATPATLRVLGKARSFRALYRLSDLALAACGLAAALFLQALALLAETLRWLLRPRKAQVA